MKCAEGCLNHIATWNTSAEGLSTLDLVCDVCGGTTTVAATDFFQERAVDTASVADQIREAVALESLENQDAEWEIYPAALEEP